MTRLLIGYDASDAARAAIATAAALFPGAETAVAHVHPPPPTLDSGALARAALPDTMIREGIDRMRAEAEDRARAIADDGAELARAAKARPGVSCSARRRRASCTTPNARCSSCRPGPAASTAR